jgi:hypothetical protein
MIREEQFSITIKSKFGIITYQRLYLAGQTVHEQLTNARIALPFVYSWSIRGRFSHQIINPICDGRLLQFGTKGSLYKTKTVNGQRHFSMLFETEIRSEADFSVLLECGLSQ